MQHAVHTAKPESSRAATNRLLLDLRAQRWRSTAWAQFVAAATARSVEQATVHRVALAQPTALHCLFLMMGRGARLRWVATSWTLTALHLGMLENRSHLGAANTLTLVRANFPVTGAPLGRWLGISALTTDFVDGKLARHTGHHHTVRQACRPARGHRLLDLVHLHRPRTRQPYRPDRGSPHVARAHPQRDGHEHRPGTHDRATTATVDPPRGHTADPARHPRTTTPTHLTGNKNARRRIRS